MLKKLSFMLFIFCFAISLGNAQDRQSSTVDMGESLKRFLDGHLAEPENSRFDLIIDAVLVNLNEDPNQPRWCGHLGGIVLDCSGNSCQLGFGCENPCTVKEKCVSTTVCSNIEPCQTFPKPDSP